jgi:hypothetical protein
VLWNLPNVQIFSCLHPLVLHHPTLRLSSCLRPLAVDGSGCSDSRYLDCDRLLPSTPSVEAGQVGEGSADAHDELNQPDRKAQSAYCHMFRTRILRPSLAQRCPTNRSITTATGCIHANFVSGFMAAAETTTRTLSQKPMVLLRPSTS